MKTGFRCLALFVDLLGECRFLPVGLINAVAAGQVVQQAVDHHAGNPASARVDCDELPCAAADHLILQVEHALQGLNIRCGGMGSQTFVGFADVQ